MIDIVNAQGVLVKNQYLSQHVNAYHGDTVEVCAALPANSVDHIAFSPPFSMGGRDLFVYSASDRDVGNSREDGVFQTHLGFLAPSLYRALKPGRVMAVHCMDIQATITHQGYIGAMDFPGELVRVFQRAGFIYGARITIWKDPEVAEQRTHARTLGHHLMCDDSSMSAVGLPDYVLLMRKPGANEVPIKHDGDPLATKDDDGKPRHWQQWASPVWYPPSDLVWATRNGVHFDGFAKFESPRQGNPDKLGVLQGDTLNGESGKRAASGPDDTRHMCPLQLPVYDRLLDLYTKQGEILLEPFGGIGSGAFVAVKKGRRCVTAELNDRYFEQLVKNVRSVEPGAAGQQTSLLDLLAPKVTKCADCNEPGAPGDCGICGGVVS